MTEEEITIAIANYTPKEPERVELGGDYYYQCPMYGCNKIISSQDNYCKNCGQRFDWSEIL